MEIILIGLFLVLNAFDMLITDYNLRHGAIELNPDWAGMDRVTLPMVIDKVQWTVALLIIYFVFSAFYSDTIWILFVANGFYIHVLTVNIKTYFDVRG